MKQQRNTHRHAFGLLLAAVALPSTALLAQTTEPGAPQAAPDTAVPSAPVSTSPTGVDSAPAPVPATPAPAMEPVVNTTPSGNEPGVRTPAAARAPEPRPAARTRTPQPARATAPSEPIPDALAEEPVQAPELIATEIPPPVPEPVAIAPQAARPVDESRALVWPLIIGGLAVLGLLAGLLIRSRRRRREALEYDTIYVEPEATAPAAAFAASPGPAVGAAPTADGRPALDLQMRPVRAGVDGDDAVVEFELTVDNQGEATARDIRLSAWMLPAGTARGSEMERMLIDRPAEAKLPEIEAGDARRFKSMVALSTGKVAEDSLLPVVVAEARYRLADGSEDRISASFAVGVPVDGELAHFDVENPSGMHDNVEARQIDELEPA